MPEKRDDDRHRASCFCARPHRCGGHHDGSAALVVVISADIDPSPSIRRPHPAPAAIVGGVGQRRSACERKAMEAVMEAVPEREPWGREAMLLRRRRSRKTIAAEMRTCGEAAYMRASTHAADMASCHAATHAAATAVASERRGRSSKRGAKCGCHRAPENLVAHPNYSVVETRRNISPQRENNARGRMIRR